MVDVVVNESNIHGKGVFAKRGFKKGEIVIRYNLKFLTKGEFAKLSESEKHYTSKEENGAIWLFPSPERYVNHSCEPNTNPNLKEKFDFAIRDIKKGEEILTDYRLDDVPDLNMKCNCGSKHCKKIIRKGN